MAEAGISLPLAGPDGPEAGTRGASFSYTCNRCNRCCRDKRIQVNPYEVLRLSRNRRMGTGEFIERYVDVSRMALRKRADGSCAFLGPDGCMVHADRPLVCRLYPLGRVVRGEEERWVVLPPAPGSEGRYASAGSVESHVRQQGAPPYMRAADAYHGLLERVVVRAHRDGRTDSSLAAEQGETEEGATGVDRDGRWLLDVDAHIRTSDDPDADVARHVAFLLDELSTVRRPPETRKPTDARTTVGPAP